ncbi:MAG: hypothetical protein JJ934_03320 [Pseudomonadales bacterium]|nr:hypothetical protein [Pseudomonadales bacterium]
MHFKTAQYCVIALTLVFCPATSSEEVVSQTSSKLDGEIETPVMEVWEIAGDYALEHPVVAIALYAPKGDPRIEQARAALESWFAERSIPTKTFIGESKGGGYGASYYVKGLAFGPAPINAKALPNMEGAARVYPSAWPERGLSMANN